MMIGKETDRGSLAPEQLKARRDRRARLAGLGCVAAAGGFGWLHDALSKLPGTGPHHTLTQLAITAMLVLGMLGCLLIVDGRKLFEHGEARARRRGRRPRRPSARTAPEPLFDSSMLDSRSGVAILLAARAISAAAITRAAQVDDLDRHRRR
jgi:hypothetical protein